MTRSLALLAALLLPTYSAAQDQPVVLVVDTDGDATPHVLVVISSGGIVRTYAGTYVLAPAPGTPPSEPEPDDPVPPEAPEARGKLESAVRAAVMTVPEASRDIRLDLGATYRVTARWVQQGLYSTTDEALAALRSYVLATLGKEQLNTWRPAANAVIDAVAEEAKATGATSSDQIAAILRRAGRTMETMRP